MYSRGVRSTYPCYKWCYYAYYNDKVNIGTPLSSPKSQRSILLPVVNYVLRVNMCINYVRGCWSDGPYQIRGRQGIRLSSHQLFPSDPWMHSGFVQQHARFSGDVLLVYLCACLNACKINVLYIFASYAYIKPHVLHKIDIVIINKNFYCK